MGRRAEPTLTEPRFPNNEPRLEIRGSSKVWNRLPAARLRLRIKGCNCCDHFDSERVASWPSPPCSLERFVGNARFHLGCDGSGGGETGGCGKIRWKRNSSK
jgi:hypothetical protein